MNENTLNLINAIAAGDALETENAFNAAMAEKISTKLEDMRAQVAQNMFATQEAVVEEEKSSEEEDKEDKEENEDKK
jgi:thymidine phosphorylase